MAEDEDQIQDYLKRLSNAGPIKPEDTFGSEDAAWTG